MISAMEKKQLAQRFLSRPEQFDFSNESLPTQVGLVRIIAEGMAMLPLGLFAGQGDSRVPNAIAQAEKYLSTELSTAILKRTFGLGGHDLVALYSQPDMEFVFDILTNPRRALGVRFVDVVARLDEDILLSVNDEVRFYFASVAKHCGKSTEATLLASAGVDRAAFLAAREQIMSRNNPHLADPAHLDGLVRRILSR
jgi:hypothetical protein